MNKSELIEVIAKKSGVSKVKAGDMIDAFIAAVTGALKSGDGVTLIGFGSFSVVERKARTGRNPRTGDTIKIAARKTPRFKPGKGLKDAIAKKKK